MTTHEFVKHQRWERPATIGFLAATKHSALERIHYAF
jgi:hypothetical protein